MSKEQGDTPAAAPTPALVAVEAVPYAGTWQHAGQAIEPGTVVEVSPSQAERLVAAGAARRVH